MSTITESDPIIRRQQKLTESALNNTVRRRILTYVQCHPTLPIGFIADDLRIERSVVEHHINVLKRVGAL